MTQLPSAFNSADHKDMNDYTPLPEGDYVAHIVKSEMKQTKAKDGSYLQLDFEVLQGDCKGRKFWARLNLLNKSTQAVGIAQQELGTIARAAFGHDQVVSDSQVLHGKPMLVSLQLKPATSTNPASNNITFYKALGGGAIDGSGADPFEDDDSAKSAAVTSSEQDLKTEPWDDSE